MGGGNIGIVGKDGFVDAVVRRLNGLFDKSGSNTEN